MYSNMPGGGGGEVVVVPSRFVLRWARLKRGGGCLGRGLKDTSSDTEFSDSLESEKSVSTPSPRKNLRRQARLCGPRQ